VVKVAERSGSERSEAQAEVGVLVDHRILNHLKLGVWSLDLDDAGSRSDTESDDLQPALVRHSVHRSGFYVHKIPWPTSVSTSPPGPDPTLTFPDMT
jgi:hypothetical protein